MQRERELYKNLKENEIYFKWFFLPIWFFSMGNGWEEDPQFYKRDKKKVSCSWVSELLWLTFWLDVTCAYIINTDNWELSTILLLQSCSLWFVYVSISPIHLQLPQSLAMYAVTLVAFLLFTMGFQEQKIFLFHVKVKRDFFSLRAAASNKYSYFCSRFKLYCLPKFSNVPSCWCAIISLSKPLSFSWRQETTFIFCCPSSTTDNDYFHLGLPAFPLILPSLRTEFSTFFKYKNWKQLIPRRKMGEQAYANPFQPKLSHHVNQMRSCSYH